MSDDSIPRQSRAPALPGPLEHWIEAAVEGLAPEPEAQFRAEYACHIEDALTSLRSEGMDEQAAIEKTLIDLGESKSVRTQLHNQHPTQSDLEFLAKLSRGSREGLLRTRWRRIAFCVLIGMPSVCGLLAGASNLPKSAMAWLPLAALIVLAECDLASAKRILISTSSTAPFNAVWLAIFAYCGPPPVLLMMLSLPTLMVSVQSLRAIRLFLKLRRIGHFASVKPQCRE
jgi:hypothetical protein